jgi:hypothetical protein
MKLSRSQLQPSESPLIGFRGKKINALGKISLPVSFGGQENARTEYVTFDVVDLYYPYNAIFGRGFINKFNAAIHMGYLCMKMSALHGTITVYGSQKEARNIKRAIYKSQRNINCRISQEQRSRTSGHAKGEDKPQRSRRNKISTIGECNAR